MPVLANHDWPLTRIHGRRRADNAGGCFMGDIVDRGGRVDIE